MIKPGRRDKTKGWTFWLLLVLYEIERTESKENFIIKIKGLKQQMQKLKFLTQEMRKLYMPRYASAF